MLDRWVDAIKLSTPNYADSPDEFLHESAESWIDGVYHAVAESDYSHLMQYCLRIASTRTSEGFRFSEVMKAISLATEIV
ncbi:MAG: hypothetical protein MUO84_06980, partial [Thermoplasmata archaeon]|nr:hypothetical protein [Thermoplasmata archaeon]